MSFFWYTVALANYKSPFWRKIGGIHSGTHRYFCKRIFPHFKQWKKTSIWKPCEAVLFTVVLFTTLWLQSAFCSPVFLTCHLTLRILLLFPSEESMLNATECHSCLDSHYGNIHLPLIFTCWDLDYNILESHHCH